jgi:molybdopterin-guanine dinucleotide biosynthesis protein
VEDALNKSALSNEEKNEKEKAAAEMAKYGRQWIWDGYISENRKDNWMDIAEKMRHINKHVVEDIQDFIIVEGFKPKTPQDKKEIGK